MLMRCFSWWRFSTIPPSSLSPSLPRRALHTHTHKQTWPKKMSRETPRWHTHKHTQYDTTRPCLTPYCCIPGTAIYHLSCLIFIFSYLIPHTHVRHTHTLTHTRIRAHTHTFTHGQTVGGGDGEPDLPQELPAVLQQVQAGSRRFNAPPVPPRAPEGAQEVEEGRRVSSEMLKSVVWWVVVAGDD